MLKDLFKKARYISVPLAQRVRQEAEVDLPDDLYRPCPSCGKAVFREEFEAAHKVCPLCGRHERLTAPERILTTADADSFEELFADVQTVNPLEFPGYTRKIDVLRKKTGLEEAVVTGRCRIQGHETLLAVMDSRFLMASMGSVVGEKLTRLFEAGRALRLPVILFAASGGARMQEGILSLMQMAKVCGAVGAHGAAGGLYITVLTDPTTGGVTASFAMLGDIILAEPGALIGFAGKRVIEGTIHHQLPEGFQSAEFQQAHGFVDGIVPRGALRDMLGKLLAWHRRPGAQSAADEPAAGL
ncbi:MAG: acetyl-CoA carboxylase, carboxyltransferase subunit beta [Oscillospiraceae bacterium]|jgi:acetyl-CoA carboxylase carboxyl transferase subunit beta|nr:acetyl-CoA carboxylase, carboxyltransferase subunit beta [Oscillospiraceae bacterium]